MTFLIVAVIVLALLAIGRMWFLRRKYKRLFAEEHFAELLRLLPGLKTAATTRVGEPFHPADDPRVAISRSGLAVFYSVNSTPTGYLHHLSLSYGGSPLAFAAGGRFLYVMLAALGMIGKLIAVAHTDKGITHGVFRLSEAEEHDYERRAPEIGQTGDLRHLIEGATRWLESYGATGQLLRTEAELLARVDAT